jgi:hypothetical protein
MRHPRDSQVAKSSSQKVRDANACRTDELDGDDVLSPEGRRSRSANFPTKEVLEIT